MSRRDKRGGFGPLAEALRARQLERLARARIIPEQPRVDTDALWRELVDARRDAALARADLEGLEQEAKRAKPSRPDSDPPGGG